MWGRSVYSLQASFVWHYQLGRSDYNLTPSSAVQFALRVVEKGEAAPEAFDSVRRVLDFSAGVGYSNCQEALDHGIMKAANECFTLPSRGKRKFLNRAPQLNPPDTEKKPTVKRSSSRLSTQGSPTSKPATDCTFLEKMSNTKTNSTDDSRNEDVPIRFVSYLSDRRGMRQRIPGSKQVKDLTNSLRAQSVMRQPTVTKNPPEMKSKSGLGKRPRVTVGEDIGRKDPIDDHQQERKKWVSVPLDDMDIKVGNTGRNGRSLCPEADPTRIRSSENETVKREDGGTVDISVVISKVSEVMEESRKILKEKSKGRIDDNILPDLLKAVTGVKGFICEVERMAQNLREGKQAEKAECEANAAAERQKLQDEITKLKQINRTALAEKLRVQRERNKLQKDYVGTLERAKKSLRLELDRENAEVSAALAAELAKEQEKSFCQICFTTPRDAVVLPCMHFQYCNECLQKHQKRSADCPTCRGKISGVLRCNLSTS